jgi:hypothetical protein
MGRILALIVVVGLSVSIAHALDETPPEKDYQLAKLKGAQPQKIGVLTYYPNRGGGYTFMGGETIVFCALPYEPTTRQLENLDVPTIGTSKVPFGGQTVYRSEIIQLRIFDEARRMDTPLAKWTRDTPNGKFRLLIMAEDSETRVKLKSIVPVLEHAGRAK